MANLLKLTAQSKRMLVTLGTAAAITLLRNTSYQPRIVERLAEAASDKNAATRERATEFLRVTLELCFERESGRALFVRAGGLETMERVLVKTLGDANNMVRERSREVFGLCRQHWPERCEAYVKGVLRVCVYAIDTIPSFALLAPQLHAFARYECQEISGTFRQDFERKIWRAHSHVCPVPEPSSAACKFGGPCSRCSQCSGAKVSRG